MLSKGTLVDKRYKVRRMISEGGMGEIYEVDNLKPATDEPSVLALKVLKPDILIQGGQGMVYRFQREADIPMQLGDLPHILPIYKLGFDRDNELHYFTMKLLENSKPFSAQIGGRRSIDEIGKTLKWFIPFCRTCAAMHRRKIFHRDMKPENILIDKNGQPYLIDFGLAHDGNRPSLTSSIPTGFTERYASPEQLNGGFAEGQSDQYSLAKSLFQYAMGCADQDLASLTGQPLPEIPGSDPLIKSLNDVLQQATNSDKKERFSDMDAFADALSGKADEIATIYNSPTLPPSPEPKTVTVNSQEGKKSKIDRRRANKFPRFATVLIVIALLGALIYSQRDQLFGYFESEPDQPVVVPDKPVIVSDPKPSAIQIREWFESGVEYANSGLIMEDTAERNRLLQLAIDHFKKVVEANPKNHKAFHEMGTCYNGMGKPEMAIEALEKAVSLQPDNEDYKRVLELTRAQINQ